MAFEVDLAKKVSFSDPRKKVFLANRGMRLWVDSLKC